jgi:sulfite reductase alpha subunit-like flavoprotein
MDGYPIQQLISEQYIVMVAATTGQGDEPDAMRPFWRFLLRKNLPTTSLANVGGIAVFGLGDSSYTKFNYSAIKLHKRLGQIGATFIAGLGLADDQHLLGVDGALEPWLEELWTNLLARIPLPPGREIIPDTVRAAPRFAISVVNPPSYAGVEAASCAVRPNAPPHAIEAAMVRNERMTSVGHFQDVRHITLATGSALQHVPGDVLYIMPKNPPALVAEVAGYFGLSHDTLLRLDPEPGGAGPAVPAYFTDTSGRPVARSAMAVLTEYLDIQAVPRRYFFELLASFATDLREAERLRELCSAEGQDDLLAYCNRMKRTSIEALRDFPSAQAGLQLE